MTDEPPAPREPAVLGHRDSDSASDATQDLSFGSVIGAPVMRVRT
ncbi:hypothetical protein [Gordonia rhizosphera]|nr:hypothetical protein [Gordonia rhizosphera]